MTQSGEGWVQGCHTNPNAVQDRQTVLSRGDILNLPTLLKNRIGDIAAGPHSYLPVQASAEGGPTEPPLRLPQRSTGSPSRAKSMTGCLRHALRQVNAHGCCKAAWRRLFRPWELRRVATRMIVELCGVRLPCGVK